MAETKSVETSFNSLNKDSYIHQKSVAYINFTRNTLPKFVSVTWDFQSSLHELFPPHRNSFPCVRISTYELYLIKPSYFTDTVIYLKPDPGAGNTAHLYHHLYFLYFSEQRMYVYIQKGIPRSYGKMAF